MTDSAVGIKDHEFEVLLIQEVKKRPFLYNKADKNFFNSAMKHDEWDYIASAISNSLDFPYLTGGMCSSEWSDLRKRFDRDLKNYKDIRSGDEFPADLDWLVITEMQFMRDHTQNRAVRSTIDIERVTCSSWDRSMSSASSEYVQDLQDEQDRFSKPLFPQKKIKVWLAPWEEKEKLAGFQTMLPEKVSEMDEFANVKYLERNTLIATAQKLGEKINTLSRLVLNQNNSKQIYTEILQGVMKEMSLINKLQFYDEAKSYIALLQSD